MDVIWFKLPRDTSNSLGFKSHAGGELRKMTRGVITEGLKC